MVDVTRPSGVDPVTGADWEKHRQHRDEQNGGQPPARDAAARRRGPRNIDDVAYVMGIPPAEMTPRVQEALDIIVGEYDRTRSDLERERERVAHFQALSERDAILPVDNRRTLIRELTRLANRAAQTHTVSSLLMLHIRHLDAVRLRRGRAAADGILRRAAEVLLANLRASDVVASVGGSDLAVILALTDGTAAADKARALADGVAAAIAEDGGDGEPPAVDWGLAAFAAGDDAEGIVTAADRDLRRRYEGH